MNHNSSGHGVGALKERARLNAKLNRDREMIETGASVEDTGLTQNPEPISIHEQIRMPGIGLWCNLMFWLTIHILCPRFHPATSTCIMVDGPNRDLLPIPAKTTNRTLIK